MLDTKVLDWIAEKVTEGLAEEQRATMLRILKEHPNDLVGAVNGDLLRLANLACIHFGESIPVQATGETAREIVDHMKVFYEEELVTIS